jgi:ankyrin repeat protein
MSKKMNAITVVVVLVVVVVVVLVVDMFSEIMEICLHTQPQELEQYIILHRIDPKDLPISQSCYHTQGHDGYQLVQHYQKCEIMLNHGADANQRHGNNRTCLMNACMFVNETTNDLCDLLLSHGANINDTSPYDDGTVLNIVSRSCSVDAPNVVLHLLRCGADPNLTHDEFSLTCGKFPLMTAIVFQSPYRVEICQHLLRYNANPNQLGKNGHTCLHASLYQTKTLLMDESTTGTAVRNLLLDYGADPSIKDKDNKIPYGLEQLLQQRQQLHNNLKILLLDEQTKESSILYHVNQYLIDKIVDYTYKTP